MATILKPQILAVVLVIFLSSAYLISIASADPGEIWAVDADGTTKQVFNPGDAVYVKGVGLRKGLGYRISIVEDTGSRVGPGDDIPNGLRLKGSIEIITTQTGSFGPVVVWSPPLVPGYYDVFADCLEPGYGTVGVYDPGIDAKDEEYLVVATWGFFVIPDLPLGTLTVLLASVSATLMVKRKRIL